MLNGLRVYRFKFCAFYLFLHYRGSHNSLLFFPTLQLLGPTLGDFLLLKFIKEYIKEWAIMETQIHIREMKVMKNY